MTNLFFKLLQVALGTREEFSRVPNAQEWEKLYEEAENQAIVGILLTGLERLPAEMLPPLELKLQWIGEVQIIQHENKMKDKAVVNLCRKMEETGIRVFVFKGQTLAAIYPDSSLRQSGDIDFFVHPDDWEKASKWAAEFSGEDIKNTNSLKHVEWNKEEVQYEMHNLLATFTSPRHRKYWKKVEKELWQTSWTVNIEGYDVPTLSPVYNILYVFVHLFQHFIKDGIGLRQIVDWYMLLTIYRLEANDVELLECHLNGLGLRKAFIGFGAILTDYLELEPESFPFAISAEEHKEAPLLIENILELGNFGQNHTYSQERGVIHGLEHIVFVAGQVWRFGHYAPSEMAWKIPDMFRWWTIKLWRMMRR